MKINAKWGFGMAPLSAVMEGRYTYAVEAVNAFLKGYVTLQELDANAVSELKGMLNRCIRQDQWDWFSVHMRFGQPSRAAMQQAVQSLVMLRKCAINNDESPVEQIKSSLKHAGFQRMIEGFLHDVDNYESDGESVWIYVLSTREQPDILKVGMTTRSIFDRVREINSATGVLVPWAARCIFRVENARKAEKDVFELLREHRVRSDREFFCLDFFEAQRMISSYLEREEGDTQTVGDALSA